MNRTRLSVINFTKKSWSKSFINGIVYNKIGFKCICWTVSSQNTQLFYKLFTRATEPGRPMGGWIFRNILSITVPKNRRGKVYLFWEKLSKLFEFYYLESGLYPSFTDIVDALYTLIQETQSHQILYHNYIVSDTEKIRFILQWKIWYCIPNYGPGTHFW